MSTMDFFSHICAWFFLIICILFVIFVTYACIVISKKIAAYQQSLKYERYNEKL